MRRNIVLLSFTLGCLSHGLSAQQITATDAMNQAEAFLSQHQSRRAGGRGTTNAPKLSLAYTAQVGNEIHYYVFNRLDSDGFVIIGGDERAQEVLGYSDTGTFDYDRIPDNMRWFLGQYQEQIHYAIEKNLAPAPRRAGRREAAAIAKTDVAEMIVAKWDQTDPYNSEIPTLSDGTKIYTGCVNTAVAQIMHYWKYPNCGSGNYSFDYKPVASSSKPQEKLTFSADFENTNYDWENMLDAYNLQYKNGEWLCTDPAINKKAVGTLIYHVSVASQTQYGTYGSKGSSANCGDAALGLVKYFGYFDAMSYRQRGCYSDVEWEDLIYAELAAGRPVLYSGRTERNEGHSFVCHGYDSQSNAYAMNWGWGGSCNGFFVLSGTKVLIPDGTGSGGGAIGSSYSSHQSAVIGISPVAIPSYGRSMGAELDDENTTAFRLFDRQLNPISSAESGTILQLRNIRVYYESMDAHPICLNLKLVNVDTGESFYTIPYYDSYTYSKFSSYSSNIISSIPTDVPTGDYRVMPIFSEPGESVWEDVRVRDESVCPLLHVEQIPISVVECIKLEYEGGSKDLSVDYSHYCYRVYAGIYALTFYKAKTPFRVNFKLKNGDDEYISTGREVELTLPAPKWAYSDYPMLIGFENVKKDGTYQVIPICKNSPDSEWIEMTMSSDVAPLTVTISNCPPAGDINHDKKITDADLKMLVEMVLQKRETTVWGDIDDNGSCSISDVSKLVDKIK